MSVCHAVLTEEEMSFLNELTRTQSPTSSSNKHNAVALEIGSDDKAQRLMEQLGLADELKLEAQYQQYKLVFPVHLAESDFGKFNMQVSSPEIFEIGSQLRNWRYKLDHPIEGHCAIANEKFLLNELSSTGLCLNLNHQQSPEYLELEVQLPESTKPVKLKAKRVRAITKSKTAYQMQLNVEPREAIRRFLFQKHHKQYKRSANVK